jgi:hypothetical protein
MAVHAAELGTLLDVPNLNLASSETNANVSTIATPFHAADVGVRGGLQEAADCARFGRPNINVALETDGDLVARAPVKQVEIVVIQQTRCVQDTLRSSLNSPAELSILGLGRAKGAVVLRTEINRLR